MGYDCIKYFEPKTKRDLKDVLEVPESFFMLCDTVVAVDHFFQKVIVVTYVHVPYGRDSEGAIEKEYQTPNQVHWACAGYVSLSIPVLA